MPEYTNTRIAAALPLVQGLDGVYRVDRGRQQPERRRPDYEATRGEYYRPKAASAHIFYHDPL